MRLLPYKKEMMDICKKLYEKNFISGSEGNISIRLSENEILTSVSGKPKNDLTPEDFIRVDMEGVAQHSSKTPSTELQLHLEYYKYRPDVEAIIHAHPVNCIALMLAGIKLDKPFLPEMVVALGAVPTATYGTPSTSEVSHSITNLAPKTDIILLDFHGVVSAGNSLATALVKVETLEHTANSLVKAYNLCNGTPRYLNKKEVDKLIELRKTKYKVSGCFLDDYNFDS